MKTVRLASIATLACFFSIVAVRGVTPPAVPSTVPALKLAVPFGNHMVLQRELPVKVWGTAAPGSEVSVSIAKAQATATADSAGKWITTLPPMSAGGPFAMHVSDGSISINLTDVLVGEIWLCSGQSNMAWTMTNFKDRSDPTFANDIAAANDPMVRIGQVALRVAFSPITDTPVRWSTCTPESVAKYSATAYFFARSLQKRLGVPVGVMNASWGGTPAEAWADRATLDSDPAFKPAIRRLETYPAQYPKLLAAWEKRVAELKNDPTNPPLPQQPRPYEKNSHLPTAMWNAKLNPLVPMTFRGVLWYQGEADATRQQANLYAKLLPAMFTAWRAAFGRGDSLKLLIVQLPRFGDDRSGVDGSHWAQIRDAQANTVSTLKNAALCVTLDLGKTDNEHPPTKRQLGSRLAEIAAGKGPDIPHLASADFSQGQATLHFTNAASLHFDSATASSDFLLASDDHVWHIAAGERQGDSIVLRSKDVATPIAARYAWSDSPTAVLTGLSGIPIAPFRTDRWPLLADKQVGAGRDADENHDAP